MNLFRTCAARVLCHKYRDYASIKDWFREAIRVEWEPNSDRAYITAGLSHTALVRVGDPYVYMVGYDSTSITSPVPTEYAP